MIAIKDMEMPKNCAECRVRHECKVSDEWDEFDWYYDGRLEGCPLVEISTCKECKYYTVYEIEYFQTNQKEQFSYCEKYDRLGNNHLSPDYYCGDFKKRGSGNE